MMAPTRPQLTPADVLGVLAALVASVPIALVLAPAVGRWLGPLGPDRYIAIFSTMAVSAAVYSGAIALWYCRRCGVLP